MSKKKSSKGSTRKNSIRHKPGDIIMIPRPDGKLSYGKMYRNLGIGIYSLVSKIPCDVNEVITSKCAFHTFIFSTAIRDGNWKIIGHECFANDHESWTPPMWYQDPLNMKYEIRHMGEVRAASEKDIIGLEKERMWYPNGLLDELCRRLP